MFKAPRRLPLPEGKNGGEESGERTPSLPSETSKGRIAERCAFSVETRQRGNSRGHGEAEPENYGQSSPELNEGSSCSESQDSQESQSSRAFPLSTVRREEAKERVVRGILGAKRDLKGDAMKEELWGVVFDLDGVLVDSATHWKRVDNLFLRELLGEWSAEKQRSIFGMSIFAIYDLLVRDHALALSREEFLGYYTSLARRIYQEQATQIPGSERLVRELAARAVPLAVASSSAAEWIELVLDRFELRSLFQAWVGADTVGGEGKPSPRVYLEAARRLKLEPAQCIAIEDSANGVRSGVAAGMQVIGVVNGGNKREDLIGATRIVEGFSELSVESFREMV